MIVHTRYRDIPWEEATKCSTRSTPESRDWWESRRGKALPDIDSR